MPTYASEPIRIFDVSLYLDRETPCPSAPAKQIVVTLSPFKEHVEVGEMLAELAREAAASGAKTVYAIRLNSFVPNQGAKVTAMLSACQNSARPQQDTAMVPYREDLAEVVARAGNVNAYRFDTQAPGPSSSIAASRIFPQKLKSDLISRLRQMILSPETYDLTSGLRKSCPFTPSWGFAFEDRNNSAWWLVSEMCQTAILISRSDDWRRSQQQNLRKTSLEQLRTMLAESDKQ